MSNNSQTFTDIDVSNSKKVENDEESNNITSLELKGDSDHFISNQMACKTHRAPKTLIDQAKSFNLPNTKNSSLSKNLSKGSEMSFGNRNPK